MRMKSKKLCFPIMFLILATFLCCSVAAVASSHQAQAEDKIGFEGVSTVYKGTHGATPTPYFDFSINFDAPLGGGLRDIQDKVAAGEYDSFAQYVSINGKTLKEISAFSKNYGGWKPDGMYPVFGMHIEGNSLRIALCAMNMVNQGSANDYGAANNGYLFKFDGTDYIEVKTGETSIFAANAKVYYGNRWVKRESEPDYSSSDLWTSEPTTPVALKFEVEGISSVAATDTAYKMRVYFKNEVDNAPYIMGISQYYQPENNEQDRYERFAETLGGIQINGTALSAIHEENKIEKIDAEFNHITIEIPKAAKHGINASGKNLIAFSKGMNLPNGNTLNESVEYSYPGSFVAESEMTSNVDAWVNTASIAEPGEVKLNKMNFGSRQSDGRYAFRLSANKADGSAPAKLGIGTGKEAIDAFGNNITINGETVKAINAEKANSVKISLESSRIVLNVDAEVLKLDDTDKISVKKALAFDGITFAEEQDVEYTFHNSVYGYLTTVTPDDITEEIAIGNIRGFHVSETEKKFSIEFATAASDQFFFHINALFDDFEWLRQSYSGYSEFYESIDDVRVQKLIVNGVVSSIFDKIYFKYDDQDGFKSVRELGYNEVVNDVMAHYGQDYISGANLNTLSISIHKLDMTKPFSLKVEKGFVAANMKKTDKDYIYHFNPRSDELYPDVSIIEPATATVTGISAVTRADGYAKFTVKLNRTASYEENPDALSDANVLDKIKINGKTVREITASAKDASGADVANPIKARYGYQSDDSSYIVLFLEVSEAIASEGGLRFDGKDVINLLKDFSSPNKNTLAKYYGGILKNDLTWQLKNGNSEIVYEEPAPDENDESDKGKKGCGSSLGVNSCYAVGGLLLLGAIFIVVRKRKYADK